MGLESKIVLRFLLSCEEVFLIVSKRGSSKRLDLVESLFVFSFGLDFIYNYGFSMRDGFVFFQDLRLCILKFSSRFSFWNSPGQSGILPLSLRGSQRVDDGSAPSCLLSVFLIVQALS